MRKGVGLRMGTPSGRELQALSRLLSGIAGQAFPKLTLALGVDPVRSVKFVMKATAACRQPDLMQGLLQVDHNLAAVGEGQRDHAAYPLVVDVRVGDIVQTIAADLNASKKAFSVVQKFEVGHYNRCMLKLIKILVMALALVGGAAMLTACGQKGALFMPNAPESQDRATLPQSLNPWPDTPAPTTPAKK